MIDLILSFCLIFFAGAVLLHSMRLSPYWLISPAVLMVAYFLSVMMPGIFLSGDTASVTRALVAYVVWLGGAFAGLLLFSHRITGGSLSLVGRKIKGNPGVLRFFVLLAIPAVILTFAMLGRVPLFVGFSSLFGSETDMSMHMARQMNTLEHRSGETFYFGQGYLRQIYTVLSPVALLALYVYQGERRSLRDSKLIAFMAAVLFVSAALNGQIWVAVNVGILFWLGWHYSLVSSGAVARDFRIVGRLLGVYLFLLLFVFAYRYFQFLMGREFDDFFLSTLRRIYSPGAVGLFSIFPDVEPFRYGSTWLNDLSGVLPGSVQSFAYEVHYLIHGGSWGFTLSPGIVASSYANFGYVGVFSVGLIFTFIFTSLFYRLLRSDSAMRIAIAIYISFSFMIAMPGDIGSYVVNLLTAFVIYVAYVFLNSVHRVFVTRA